jgi:hypothetical protein
MANKIHITWDVIMAVLMLLVGLVLLADRLDIPAIQDLFRFWPAALIALGVAKLHEAAEGARPRP